MRSMRESVKHRDDSRTREANAMLGRRCCFHVYLLNMFVAVILNVCTSGLKLVFGLHEHLRVLRTNMSIVTVVFTRLFHLMYTTF